MVGLTREQKQDRHRRDLQQIAAYANNMMQKQFPSLDFPDERWAYAENADEVIYTANWSDGSGIRISGHAVRGLWTIKCVDHPNNLTTGAFDSKAFSMNTIVREEKNLDLLSVRCLAIEWTKHFT